MNEFYGWLLRKEKGIKEEIRLDDLFSDAQAYILWAKKLEEYFRRTQNNVGPADKVQPNEAYCHLALLNEIRHDLEPKTESKG